MVVMQLELTMNMMQLKYIPARRRMISAGEVLLTYQ